MQEKKNPLDSKSYLEALRSSLHGVTCHLCISHSFQSLVPSPIQFLSGLRKVAIYRNSNVRRTKSFVRVSEKLCSSPPTTKNTTASDTIVASKRNLPAKERFRVGNQYAECEKPYNGGPLPDIVLLLLNHGYYHRGTRLNVMKRLCLCSL